MIEESARVVRVEGDLAWVETQRRSSCGTCSAEKGCGTSAMSKLLNQKPLHIKVHNTLGAAVGDPVIIGLQDAVLVRSSLVVYLMPLAAMITAALLVRLGGAGDGVVALFGLAGLALGFAGVHAFGKRAAANPAYQAMILRRDEGYPRSLPLQYLKKS